MKQLIIKLTLFLALTCLLPACAENHDPTSTPITTPGTVTVVARFDNLMHDRHLYVVLFSNVGGEGDALRPVSFVHSPACPFDDLPGPGH